MRAGVELVHGYDPAMDDLRSQVKTARDKSREAPRVDCRFCCFRSPCPRPVVRGCLPTSGRSRTPEAGLKPTCMGVRFGAYTSGGCP